MIACVACLEPNRSIHTATFLRAVELCEQYVCGGDRAPAVTLERFDDAMRADVAARVALEIVARRPRAVVGHFASAAAMPPRRAMRARAFRCSCRRRPRRT